MSSNRTLDIVLPFYNSRKDYLRRAVGAIIKQTDSRWRLYLVDDGNTGAIVRVAEDLTSDPRVSYHRNPKNLGVARSINRGCAFGRGKYLCWVSDDDYMEPEFVEVMVGFMEENDYDFAHSLEYHVDKRGRYLSVFNPEKGDSGFFGDGYYPKHDGYFGASHIYTRAIYEKAKRKFGHWVNPKLSIIPDLDMYYKLCELGAKRAFIRKPLFNYREGTSSYGRARVKRARHTFAIIWGLKET